MRSARNHVAEMRRESVPTQPPPQAPYPDSTNLFTRPICKASSPDTARPVRIRSNARPARSSRNRTVPRSINGTPKRRVKTRQRLRPAGNAKIAPQRRSSLQPRHVPRPPRLLLESCSHVGPIGPAPSLSWLSDVHQQLRAVGSGAERSAAAREQACKIIVALKFP